MKNKKININYRIKIVVIIIGIFLLAMLYLIPNFNSILGKKEGFSWSPQSKKVFLDIQNTNYPNKIFDANMIEQNQATQEEVNYFNQHGVWPWSDSTKDLYMKAINANPYIKVSPGAALLETQKIYNETAILMALSYQTKEGQFMIDGVQVPLPQGNSAEELPNGFGDFAYKSGLKDDKSKDIIRCNMDNGTLERIHYTGQEGIYGSQTFTISNENYNNLENVIPGFQFINGPCNPCVAMREKPDYSCPFRLELKNKNPNVSEVWQKLWGLNM